MKSLYLVITIGSLAFLNSCNEEKEVTETQKKEEAIKKMDDSTKKIQDELKNSKY